MMLDEQDYFWSVLQSPVHRRQSLHSIGIRIVRARPPTALRTLSLCSLIEGGTTRAINRSHYHDGAFFTTKLGSRLLLATKPSRYCEHESSQLNSGFRWKQKVPFSREGLQGWSWKSDSNLDTFFKYRCHENIEFWFFGTEFIRMVRRRNRKIILSGLSHEILQLCGHQSLAIFSGTVQRGGLLSSKNLLVGNQSIHMWTSFWESSRGECVKTVESNWRSDLSPCLWDLRAVSPHKRIVGITREVGMNSVKSGRLGMRSLKLLCPDLPKFEINYNNLVFINPYL